MHSKIEIHPYYPPTDSFGVGCDALFGFHVNSNLDSHVDAFERLSKESFELPPGRIIGSHQDYTLSRRVPGQEASAAMYLHYDDQGTLTLAALTFAGEPCESDIEAQASAEKIRAFVIDRMGPEVIRLDRIVDWSHGPMSTPTPDVAYAAAWIADKRDLSGICDVSDAVGFFAETDKMVQSDKIDPFITAMVTSSRDMVMCIVIAQRQVHTF